MSPISAWALRFSLSALVSVAATAFGAETVDQRIEAWIQFAAEPEVSVPAIGLAEQRIAGIVISGNDVTQEQIILRELPLQVGDLASPYLLDRTRQVVLDLGLFQGVKVWLDPAPGGGSILRIAVHEKYYILPVPKLRRDIDNNWRYGAQLRFDNLFGLNQRLRLEHEIDNPSGSEYNSTVQSVVWSWPFVAGSPYQLDANLTRATTPGETEAATGKAYYTTYGQEQRFQVSRWFNKRGPTEGWRAGIGLANHRIRQDLTSGVPLVPLAEGDATGITLVLEESNLHDHVFSREGWVYGVSGEFGIPGFGSDSNYTREELYFRRYTTVGAKAHHSFDMQFRAGFASDALISAPAYGLGGGNSLRGYKGDTVKGNSYYLANFEYLAPLLDDYYPLRWLVFLDVGSAYPSNDRFSLRDPYVAAGLGLRWKLKSFVKIDLRLDVGYGFRTQSQRVYGGTREAF